MKNTIILILVVALTLVAGGCMVRENSQSTTEPGATATHTSTSGTTQSAQITTTATEPAPTTMTPITPPPRGPLVFSIVDAYPNLSFDQPLFFTAAPGDRQHVFVVERTGRIYIFVDQADVSDRRIFLDLRDSIDASGQEMGLLGLAFHPAYDDNGYFFVNYTTRDATVIARYSRSDDDPAAADPDSEDIILTYSQPYANHNGGHLEFGPDGYLYIASGDGGSSGDPHLYAQDLTSLLGKILRIDVDQPGETTPYSVPADNPFAGNQLGHREEIFAYGLRNPWRFSFDDTGVLWVADVGQRTLEEINQVISGGNYGWNIMEGTVAYKPDPAVDPADLIAPVWAYGRNEGISVTGGYVYNGADIPELKGKYVYGDFGSGRIWQLWIDEAEQVQNELLLETNLRIASFGLDAQGELYVVDLRGRIYRLTAEPV